MMLLNPVLRKINALRRATWSTVKYYAVGLYRRVDTDHVFLMGGGLAFSIVICSVPLVLIIFSLAGVILDRPFIAEEISMFVDKVVPYEQYAEGVKDLVLDRVEEFRLYKGIAGILGVFGLLVASSSVFGSMRTILNTVYRVEETKSALISKLLDFALVLLALFYFLFSASFVPLTEILFGLARQMEFLKFLRIDAVGELLIQIGSTLMTFVAAVLMYLFVPDRRTPLRVALVSALATALLWIVAQALFGFYIQHAVTLKRIYGASLLVVAVVFWVYYSSLVFILGAEIGQLSRERSKAG